MRVLSSGAVSRPVPLSNSGRRMPGGSSTACCSSDKSLTLDAHDHTATKQVNCTPTQWQCDGARACRAHANARSGRERTMQAAWTRRARSRSADIVASIDKVKNAEHGSDCTTCA